MTRMMEDAESKRQEVLQIALKVGAVKSCELHDFVYDHYGDREAAYRLGNALYTNDELENYYSTRRDLTDCILATIEELPDCCPDCESLAAE